MSISACIIYQDDLKKLAKLLESLRFCQEVLILSSKNDKQNYCLYNPKIKFIYLNEEIQDFSKIRNEFHKFATCDWLLHIDSDERLTKPLISEIETVVKQNNFEAFYIKREDVFLNAKVKYGELYNASHKGFIRLYRKNSGTWKNNVHEVFELNKGLKASYLKNNFTHLAHESVSSFILKVNNYSTLRSISISNIYFSSNIISIIFLPLIKFIYTFFFKLGFMDREVGFIYSFLMSFHSFLARSKTYASSQK
jgi:(heptosyl)LPS beta-1,4-glucosyltransferase